MTPETSDLYETHGLFYLLHTQAEAEARAKFLAALQAQITMERVMRCVADLPDTCRERILRDYPQLRKAVERKFTKIEISPDK